MYCPKCGQRQAAGKLRYCSRCGFSLRGVLSVCRKDIVQGVLLMVIGLFLIRGFAEFVAGFVGGFRAGSGSEIGETFTWSADRVFNLFSVIFFIWGLSRIGFALFVEWNRRQRGSFPPTDLDTQLRESRTAAFPQERDTSLVDLTSTGSKTQELTNPSLDQEESTRRLKNG